MFVTGCGGGGGGSNITLTTNEQGEDPVLLEIPVAYVRRPIPDAPTDLRDPLAFNPGARLLVRDRAQASADELDVTDQIAAIVAEETGADPLEIAIDIKDLESSYDGGTLLFAARAVPEPVAANLEETTWNLWTFDFETREAQYLIPSRIKRNEGVENGGGQDIAPHFLGDDRIVFSSTRQVTNQARQLNDGRNQIFAALDEDEDDPAVVLHIYDPQRRTEEFTQISHNLSHDLDPSVLASGEIIFSRWNNSTSNHLSIFRILPNGMQLSPFYGYNSQNAGTEGSAVEFTQPRELDDGRLISVMRPFASSTFGGEIVIIDAVNYADVDQPTWANQGIGGQGQESLTQTEVRTDGLRSLGGQFGSVYPLRDGTQRLLVTWTDCRVIAEDADPEAELPQPGDYLPCTLDEDNTNVAPPVYGAWVYDPVQDTQLPIVVAEEGFLVSEIIAAEPRDFPSLAGRPITFNSDLAASNQGQLLIDSVYDIDGVDASPEGIANHAQPGTNAFLNRPARFLRLVQPVPIPDPDVYEIPDFAYGVNGSFGFREILGYVPVEPDGSVTVTVPSERPFNFDVLDSNGRRIGNSHDYWLQIGSGEVLQCVGCHEPGSALPHGRLDSQPPSANPGAQAVATGGIGFAGTDTDILFATDIGQTMAETWDFHQPLDNEVAVVRELSLSQAYFDEWSGPDVEPEPAIDDRDYDPNWTDIPIETPLVVGNLDPSQPRRIVINYLDHIQVIWQRERAAVVDAEGNDITNCVGCHSSADEMAVPAGQLDLSAAPSDIDPDHLRSFRELLDGDNEQWLDNDGALVDRQRECTTVNEAGDIIVSLETLPLPARMQAGSANGSGGFFACFEGGSCGLAPAPPLPDNCTEDTGVPEPRTLNTIDHTGMLSPAELRLLSEWLDIGAQYYNNPFDIRLAD